MSELYTQVQLSDGAKLNVCLLGAEHKSKRLIISLHGAPGLSSHTGIKEDFKFLAGRFRVLVYDLRGSGDSEVKGPFTDEQWMSDLEELRAWAGDEKFILAGGSYGGFLALNYALNYPNRLLALILRNTWACGPQVQSQEDAEQGVAEIATTYTPESNPEPESFEGASTEPRWEVHNAAFSWSQPRFDVSSRLAEINVPTLVVVGRLDIICPVEESEMIRGCIKGSELVVFEKSAHNPATDEPEKFRGVLSDFLGRLEW
ncbi:Proline iminopeptidase [Fusarium agapanthi]|uniref:Proline iminopeptidase n=1 Tax=Fusarium agapanthi TaxID=1803897 RepID=A0A9P5E7Q1_9HYPO|nr:Proline iminopeptidase [Fusarium agapanthi]